MQLKIGELAKLGGCQVVTIRYYEKAGLLSAPARTEGNYRLYDEGAAERLHFIRHCRLHGMTLSEIRELLQFRDHPTRSCRWVSQLVEKHIASVEAQIVELSHLKEHLQTLLRSCSGDRGGDCGILEHITGTECECCKALHCHLDGARDSRKG